MPSPNINLAVPFFMVNDMETSLQFYNMWVVCFSDPEGYKLDFESLTDVPEETNYNEWKKTINKPNR
jgi:hypothetical protein